MPGSGWLAELITLSLASASAAVSRRTAMHYRRDHGLTDPEFVVLYALGCSGGETKTARAICRATHMDKAKISRAVSALSDRGWVVRERDQNDRRFENLALTSAGSRSLQEILPAMQASETEILSKLSESERGTLESGLDTLRRNLED